MRIARQQGRRAAAERPGADAEDGKPASFLAREERRHAGGRKSLRRAVAASAASASDLLADRASSTDRTGATENEGEELARMVDKIRRYRCSYTLSAQVKPPCLNNPMKPKLQISGYWRHEAIVGIWDKPVVCHRQWERLLLLKQAVPEATMIALKKAAIGQAVERQVLAANSAKAVSKMTGFCLQKPESKWHRTLARNR